MSTAVTYTMEAEKAAKDNTSQQCNPEDPKYEGHQKGYQGKGDKADLDNHSQQLDPQNPKHEAPKAQTQ